MTHPALRGARRDVASAARVLALIGALCVSAEVSAAPPPADAGPPRLRICCALGHDLALAVSDIHLPVDVANVVSADALGRHGYVARSVFEERNGLAYTCRGGFVDVAHVRSTADTAGWIFSKIAPVIGSGQSIELQGGDGKLRLSFPPRELSAEDRPKIARAVAARVAYELAVWHELVTWAGARTVSVFSEAFSAFSPEDLYSDLLGAVLAERALASARPWDEAMDDELIAALSLLGARTGPETVRALDLVEGRWWDRRVPVPKRELLLARSFDAGPILEPWRVPGARRVGCADDAKAWSLDVRALDPSPQDPAGATNAAGVVAWSTPELLDVPAELARTRKSVGPIGREELAALVAEAAREARAEGIKTEPDPQSRPGREGEERPHEPGERAAREANDHSTREANDHSEPERSPEDEARARAEAWAEARRAAAETRARRDAGDSSTDLDAEQGGSIRLFPVELAGGVTRGGDLDARGGLGALEVRGGHADTSGGQLTAVRFSTAWRSDREVLATRFIGIEARSLFFCRDRASGELHAPVAAWFQDCEPGGSLGLEGMLAGVQLDGGIGRMIVRPIELALALDVLQTAFTPSFFRRRLVLFAGASVDAHSLQSGPHGVAPHVLGGARLLLRTPGLGVELEAYGSWRQGLIDTDDHALETGLRLGRRFVLARDDATGIPSATFILGLEGGWSWWTRPETSMATFVLPVISDVEPHTVHALATLGLAFERLGF